MPNIAVVLKEEIQRLARKEARQASGPLSKKITSLSRNQARQKKEIAALLKELSGLRKAIMADKPAPIAARAMEVEKARIGPRSIRAQRKRLKLTQAQYAKLIGVSAPTVLAWEKGKAEPRREKLTALIGVRKVTRAEVRRRLGLAPVKKKAVARKRVKRKARGKGKRA